MGFPPYFESGPNKSRLIAIMLGRLEMEIDDCITAYVKLSDGIFKRRRRRLSLRGKIRSRFDTAELERGIKEIISRATQNGDSLLKHENGCCKVYVKPSRIEDSTDLFFSQELCVQSTVKIAALYI